MDFDSAKILVKNKNARSRRFLEGFYSKFNDGAFNRYMDFSELYAPIVSKKVC